MKKVIKVGHSEATALALTFIGAKAFLGYPRLMTELGATAGWLIVLISGGTSIVFWLLISSLFYKYPGKSLAVITEEVLGPVIGLGVNGLILIYMLVSASIMLRQFSEAIILSTLPEAPISSLSFLLIIPAFISAYLGVEAISRSAYIALPFILLGSLAVLLFQLPYFNLNYLLPILGQGVFPLLKYGFLGVSSFGEVLLLAYLVPYFSFDASRLRAVGILSLLVVTGSFALIVLVYLMVFPMPLATENLIPFFQLSRIIGMGRYFQRVESVFILFWTFTAFLRISLGVLIAAIIMRDSLKLLYYRPLLPAISILIFSMALTPADLMTVIQIEGYRLPFGWIFTFVLPLGVWLFSFWRGKGGKVDGRQKG